jgi:DNA-binding NarL/FixJ family response regulator
MENQESRSSKMFPMSDRLRLSEREREIVQLVAGGLRNKEVAAKLGLKPKTVEKHRANIMNKLALRNVAQLIRYAIQSGLTPLEIEEPPES